MTPRYCAYCGRLEHRCQCGDENSLIRQFFARGQTAFAPRWLDESYKRGMPPQIKRRERLTMRHRYAVWYTALVETHGAQCANCGVTELKLVIDHVLSIAKGGLSTLDNLQLLCVECNRIKGKLCIDCRNTPQ
jgi:5-methylcytosine-specific restriction endonuclease McrA